MAGFKCETSGAATESNMTLGVTAPISQAAGALATWTLTPGGADGAVTYSVGALTKPGGSSATISGGTTSTPSLTTDNDGVYTFTATATDANGNTASRDCTVSLDSGGGGGGAAWVDLQDYDFTDVVSQSQVTSGTVTLAFASSADTIDMTVSTYASSTAGVTPTNGSGLVYGGGGAAGTMTAAYDWVSELASTWDRAYALGAPVAVHFVLTGVAYPGTADDGIFMGLSTTTAHNSGSRGWYLRRDAVATDEDRRVRVNTSNSTIIDTPAIKSSRVLTVILLAGTVVEVMDTSGTTPPAPAIGGANTYSVGCSSLSTLASQPTFVSTAYAYLSLIEQAEYTVTRMLVQRYQ